MVAKLMARVKKSDRANMIMAFGGSEYVKYEWRPVPAGDKIAAQAMKHESLDVMAADKIKAEAPAPAKKAPAKKAEIKVEAQEPDED